MNRRRAMRVTRRPVLATGAPGDPAPAVAWTPKDVPGNILRLWLKADVGVTPTPTFTWSDQSGLGNDATQLNVGVLPTYNTSSSDWAGKPCVSFSHAIGQYLQCDTLGSLLAGDHKPVSIVCAVRLATLDNISRFVTCWEDGQPANDSWRFGFDDANSFTNIIELNQVANSGNSVVALGTTQLGTARHSTFVIFTGSTVSTYVDDVPDMLNAPLNISESMSTTQLTIGTRRTFPTFRGFDGDIAELIIYAGVLSAQDRLNAADYLRKKWMLP